MLSTANFKETKMPLLNEYDQGLYTDFTEEWFKDVGAIIIKTMAVASIMPVVEFFGIAAMKRGLRYLDRSFSSDFYKSKKKSV